MPCPPDCPPGSIITPPAVGPTTPPVMAGAAAPPLNPYFSSILPRFGDLVKYYADLWKSGYSDWWIGVRFGSIAAGATASPLTIRVSGYRFLALALVGVSDLPDFVLVKMTEAQPSNPLMNDFVSVRNLTGDGSRPNLLFVPRILEYNQSILVEAKNVHSTTVSQYTEVVLRGIRFYTEYQSPQSP